MQIPTRKFAEIAFPRRLQETNFTPSESRDANRCTSDGLYYEYSKAANPIGEGLTTQVPLADFPHHLHESGPSRIIPFDLSRERAPPS